LVKKILPIGKHTAKQFVKLCTTQKLNTTSTMNTKKIGWIGLGNMGIPMSQQLIKAGYPVTVYNRSKEKEASLKATGVAIASSPNELIQQTDIVFIMVSNDEAISEIFNGDSGLLSAKTTGKIIINMSTVSPGISKQMAALCREQGNDYLDAPVSGSVKQAQEGQLVIMAGGLPETFERVKPLLEVLGKLAILVGDTGAGNSAKLAINTLLGFHAQGLAETVLFAQQNNIKTEDMLTIINNGAMSNVFAKIKGDAILNDNYQAAFALKHIAKDLRLAKAEGLNSPLAQAAYQTFQAAEAEHGDEDIIAVIKQISK
jgi:3-hydroxyisobutyrate dehydrogenase